MQRSGVLIAYMLVLTGGVLILAGARDNPPFVVLQTLLRTGGLPPVGSKDVPKTPAYRFRAAGGSAPPPQPASGGGGAARVL